MRISLLPKAKALPHGFLLACFQLPEDGLKGAFALGAFITKWMFSAKHSEASSFTEFLKEVDKNLSPHLISFEFVSILLLRNTDSEAR